MKSCPVSKHGCTLDGDEGKIKPDLTPCARQNDIHFTRVVSFFFFLKKILERFSQSHVPLSKTASVHLYV